MSRADSQANGAMTAVITTAKHDVIARVRELYETHPYPHYPLFAKPRWQDGYLAHSALPLALADKVPAEPAAKGERAQILVSGAGEILPYVIRKWEPRARGVVNLDLSNLSLRRARLRLWTSTKPSSFVHGDLDAYLRGVAQGSFVHVDAYGVLHHMANPGETLQLIQKALAPGGTVRLMVYNAEARRWIHHLQRAFSLLRLELNKSADFKIMRHLLISLHQDSAALTARLGQVGGGTLGNDARLADLFLHPREARLGVGRWLSLVDAAGLKILGLLDRYGELDDLPNPLWQPPSAMALLPRVSDLRFEGNLELYLQRPGGLARTAKRSAPFRFKTWDTGPRLWWSFEETKSIPPTLRRRLWHAHRSWVDSRRSNLDARDVRALLPATLGRLARLGALLPGQLPDQFDDALRAPLTTEMDSPPKAGPAAPLGLASLRTIENILRGQGRLSPSLLAAVARRLEAARAP